jgi:GAG-pre-integrase domain/Integrase core domain
MHELVKTQKAKGASYTNTKKSESLHMRISAEIEENTWYLNSGTSNHMTGCKKHLTNFDITIQGSVRLGRGTIVIKGRNREQRAISGVYYIPKLTNNIISLGQLEERGCKVKIDDGNLKVFDKNGRLIIRVQRTRNRLYILKLNLVRSVCLKTSIEVDSQMWHARYGHINFQSLRKLSQGNIVEGLLEIECKEGMCRGCVIGKQRRSSFPDEASFRANEVLELIHEDLCGPIKPTTPVGNKYFLQLVDDFSRYIWIQLMKIKDKVFSAFKEVKEAIEVERNVKVKGFRTDRGEEFRSVKFDEYCKLKGIKRFLTAPYSP